MKFFLNFINLCIKFEKKNGHFRKKWNPIEIDWNQLKAGAIDPPLRSSASADAHLHIYTIIMVIYAWLCVHRDFPTN